MGETPLLLCACSRRLGPGCSLSMFGRLERVSLGLGLMGLDLLLAGDQTDQGGASSLASLRHSTRFFGLFARRDSG